MTGEAQQIGLTASGCFAGSNMRPCEIGMDRHIGRHDLMDFFARQFGIVIAYLLPGFIALTGLAPLIPAVAGWLQPVDQGDLGFGPPIYALLSAITVGMIVSCFRWLLLDQLHYCTGVKRPDWDHSRLDEVLDGFDYLVQNHYRYHEFTGNTTIALLWAYGVNRALKTLPFLGIGTDLGMVILSIVLLAASRSAHARYHRKAAQLLGETAGKGCGAPMYNGCHHAEESGNGRRASLASKPQVKPEGNPREEQRQDKEQKESAKPQK